ncbi:MAG: DNA-3-methyladenine glycosylase I [Patescibacteria group bacterium]|jgi:DNA-3-methyladenine glycosylase I
MKRCPWVLSADPLFEAYHDEEWGVPVHNDRKIYEFLVLETFQAGLSWRTILHKRKNFKKAFANFDYKKVARFDAKDVKRLLGDAGIIRNRQKIAAAINNAKRFMEVQKEFGTFSTYMWSWVKGKTIRHTLKTAKDFPVHIPEAVAWSKDLKKRGFSFLGPTVVYAHMQAVGMVNDHVTTCSSRNR